MKPATAAVLEELGGASAARTRSLAIALIEWGPCMLRILVSRGLIRWIELARQPTKGSVATRSDTKRGKAAADLKTPESCAPTLCEHECDAEVINKKQMP